MRSLKKLDSQKTNKIRVSKMNDLLKTNKIDILTLAASSLKTSRA